jgi:hypothetical protein
VCTPKRAWCCSRCITGWWPCNGVQDRNHPAFGFQPLLVGTAMPLRDAVHEGRTTWFYNRGFPLLLIEPRGSAVAITRGA